MPRPKAAAAPDPPKVGDVVLWLDEYRAGRPALVLEAWPTGSEWLVSVQVFTVSGSFVRQAVPPGETTGCYRRRE